MPIATANPATGQTVRTFEPLTSAELEARLQSAADAYVRHRRTPVAERARLMLRAAEILESEKEVFGRIMVTEMGKTLKAAMDEAAKSAWGCRYYAENAERFLADEVVETAPDGVSSSPSRSAPCWRSCRGISRSGRCSASPRRR